MKMTEEKQTVNCLNCNKDVAISFDVGLFSKKGRCPECGALIKRIERYEGNIFDVLAELSYVLPILYISLILYGDLQLLYEILLGSITALIIATAIKLKRAHSGTHWYELVLIEKGQPQRMDLRD